MPPPRPKVYSISASKLRRLFNEQNFPEKLRKQQVFTRIQETRPADGSRGLPPQTFTVMTEYRDGQNRFVAETHHYKQRGGTYQTEPDPKQLVIGDALYVIDPDPNE